MDSIPAETALRFNALQRARETLCKKQLAFTALCCRILDVRLAPHTSPRLLTWLQEHRAMATRLLALLSQKSTTVTKALTAKTEHLALVAESMSLKLEVLRNQALSAIYDPEALNALENYQTHLRDTETRLVARQRVVEEELRKYKNAGSDMRELVERYGQIMRAMETASKDIKRLKGQA